MFCKKRSVVAVGTAGHGVAGVLLRADDAQQSSSEKDNEVTSAFGSEADSNFTGNTERQKDVITSNDLENTNVCLSDVSSESSAPPMVRPLPSGKMMNVRDELSDISSESSSDLCSQLTGNTEKQFQMMMSADLQNIDEGPSYEGESLLVASEIGDAQAVDRILNLPDSDVNVVDENGKTVLHIASEQGFAEIVETILSHVDPGLGSTTAYLSKKDQNGQTALQLACGQNHFKVAQFLLGHPAQSYILNSVNECLLIFSSFGNLQAVTYLLLHPAVEVNHGHKKYGYTSLMAASQAGHVEIVQKLLNHERIEVNKAQKNGTTPLIVACNFGHLEIVEMLLEQKNIQVNKTSNDGVSPLMIACSNGHLEVVQKLLERNEIEVNKTTDDSVTPLFMACKEGNLEIVEMLLEQKDIKVTTTSNDGASPLMIACSNGHLEVVQKLLERKEIQINKSTDDGVTPLFMACEEGHLEIVETLLEHPAVDVNEIATERDTALTIASRKGHLQIVEVLLEHPGIDCSTYIELAINDAFSEGHGDIAHLLRERAEKMTLVIKNSTKISTGEAAAEGGGIPETRIKDLLSVNRAASLYEASVCGANPGSGTESVGTNNSRRQMDMFMAEDIDSIDFTRYEGDSLLIATEIFDAQAVGRILNHPETDVNVVDENGNTALHIASEQGLQEIVQQIISHASTDVNKQTTNAKQSALEVACGRNHVEVIMLLLDHANIDADNINYCLFVSSCFDPLEVVHLLLQHCEIDVNRNVSQLKEATALRGTPLVGACRGGRLEIVERLLERPEIEVNKATAGDGLTPLYVACQQGHNLVVQKLLERNEIEVNKTTSDGCTPFYAACCNDRVEIVEKLLEIREIEVNKATIDGCTPLFMACQEGHLEIVEKLLERSEIEVNKAFNTGDTPLHMACQEGHLEIVEKLLERNELNVAKEVDGRTALSIASSQGHQAIVSLLRNHSTKRTAVVGMVGHGVAGVLLRADDAQQSSSEKDISVFGSEAGPNFTGNTERQKDAITSNDFENTNVCLRDVSSESSAPPMVRPLPSGKMMNVRDELSDISSEISSLPKIYQAQQKTLEDLENELKDINKRNAMLVDLEQPQENLAELQREIDNPIAEFSSSVKPAGREVEQPFKTCFVDASWKVEKGEDGKHVAKTSAAGSLISPITQKSWPRGDTDEQVDGLELMAKFLVKDQNNDSKVVKYIFKAEVPDIGIQNLPVIEWFPEDTNIFRGPFSIVWLKPGQEQQNQQPPKIETSIGKYTVYSVDAARSKGKQYRCPSVFNKQIWEVGRTEQDTVVMQITESNESFPIRYEGNEYKFTASLGGLDQDNVDKVKDYTFKADIVNDPEFRNVQTMSLKEDLKWDDVLTTYPNTSQIKTKGPRFSKDKTHNARSIESESEKWDMLNEADFFKVKNHPVNKHPGLSLFYEPGSGSYVILKLPRELNQIGCYLRVHTDLVFEKHVVNKPFFSKEFEQSTNFDRYPVRIEWISPKKNKQIVPDLVWNLQLTQDKKVSTWSGLIAASSANNASSAKSAQQGKDGEQPMETVPEGSESSITALQKFLNSNDGS